MRILRSCAIALAGSTLLADASRSQSSVRSTVTTVPTPAAADFGSSISVTVNAGAVQSLGNVVDNAVNTFPSAVRLTVSWDLHPSTGSVALIGYFANPAAAMVSGPVAIPSSWLKGRVPTPETPGAPATFTAFTQTSVGGIGTAGGSLSLLTQPVLGYTRAGTLTIDLELQLDLTGRVLTPGTYTGTLNLRAVTQ